MWTALAIALVVILLVGGLGAIAFKATASASEFREESEALRAENKVLKEALEVAGITDPTLDDLDRVFNS